MEVFHARKEGGASELRSATFTGTVWGDPIMPTTADVTINNVFFAPGGRTHWHTHDQGQVLHVTSGCGWVCLEGKPPQVIRAGDVVWIGANERHWHGASDSSFMVHMATSLGKTQWAEAVSDKDYAARA